MKRFQVAALLTLSLLLGACSTLVTQTAQPILVERVALPTPTVTPAPAPIVPVANAAMPAPAAVAMEPAPNAAPTLADVAPPPPVDLWARMRTGLRLPDLDNDLVRKQEQWYASRPDYVHRMVDRGGRYLFHIVEEVERRGLPMELALLPFIESAFNPQALSSARAAGMWQFMPATGRHFDLRQNHFRDDRRDVLASTRAALDYLTRLHRMFDDWHLALAAYNWGEGNVKRAIAANLKAGLPTDYESLRMPNETRNYVPKLQAVKNIIAAPERYALKLAALPSQPFFSAVKIERDIDVVLAARLADLPEDEFRQLNPQLKKPLVMAAGTPHILLPYDKAARFTDALAAYTGPLASWTTWTAPRTLSVADAAKSTGMTEAALRLINAIPARMQIKVGATLLVARSDLMRHDVPARVADAGELLLTPEGNGLRRVVLKAGAKGETLASVAKHHGKTVEQLATWNGVDAGARFAPGARIVLYQAVVKTAQAKVKRPTNSRAPVKVAESPARPVVR